MLNENIICVGLYESEKVSYNNSYINIYSTDGKLIAEGIKVPENGFVRHAVGGDIYISLPSKLDEKNKIIPPRLVRYSLKKEFYN